jgi:spore maturation protein CgeB
MNCLILKHVEHPYYEFHCRNFRKFFDNTVLLNYAKYFAEHGESNLERHIKTIIDDNNIQMVIVFMFHNNFELTPQFLKSIKDKVSVVFWLFDEETYLHVHSKYIVQIANAVVTTCRYSVSYYEQIDIPAILYLCSYSKKDYYPVESVGRDIDVSFVGSVSKSTRQSYLDHLIANGIDVKIFGHDTKGGFLSLQEMVRTFQRSKINLNLTGMVQMKWIQKLDPIIQRIQQHKGKAIEVALTNSFVLSEYSPPLVKMFEPDKEIGIFHNKEELLEKVKYYLKNDKERDTIAKRAYSRALAEYESEIYLHSVFDQLNEILNNKRKKEFPIYLSSFHRTRHIAFLTFSIFSMLSRGRFIPALSLSPLLFKYGLMIGAHGVAIGLINVLKRILGLNVNLA